MQNPLFAYRFLYLERDTIMQFYNRQSSTSERHLKDEQSTKQQVIETLSLPGDIALLLNWSKSITCAESREELFNHALGGEQSKSYNVEYEVEPGESKLEANVVRCKNGIVVNYTEDYMRRRDPDSLIIGDGEETDKPRYSDVYGEPFEEVRQETFDWLKGQDLIVMPFMSGGQELGYPSLLIAPLNAAFFAAALADLQGFLPLGSLPIGYKPRAIVYLAPTFRHTHFNGGRAQQAQGAARSVLL